MKDVHSKMKLAGTTSAAKAPPRDVAVEIQQRLKALGTGETVKNDIRRPKSGKGI